MLIFKCFWVSIFTIEILLFIFERKCSFQMIQMLIDLTLFFFFLRIFRSFNCDSGKVKVSPKSFYCRKWPRTRKKYLASLKDQEIKMPARIIQSSMVNVTEQWTLWVRINIGNPWLYLNLTLEMNGKVGKKGFFRRKGPI